MASMSEFFTRPKANAGVVVKIPRRPNGQPCEEWVRVLGVDSDAFREAEASERRELMRIGQIADESERKKSAAVNGLEWHRRLMASLVPEWSFDEPCTVENVREAFKNAPYIQDKVEEVANNSALFFGTWSEGSASTPSTSSDNPES